jgi:hypothetical protein
MDLTEKKVHWWPTLNPEGPRWAVWYGGDHLELAVLGDGPAPRYLLSINGRRDKEFADWPPDWTVEPDDSPGLAAQKAEYEYEIEKWEKNKNVSPVEESDLKDQGV